MAGAAAWEGMSRAWCRLSGEVAGIVALTEVVIHGLGCGGSDRAGLRTSTRAHLDGCCRM